MSGATLQNSKRPARGKAGSPALGAAAPRLLNGDHLTVPEFERRYEATPDIKFAELIEGIVVMSPPISSLHSDTHGLLYALLKHYARATPGVGATLCASLRLDGQNEYQPDAMLRIKSGPQARCKVGPDGLLEGSPELAAEIAISSAGYDLHEKKAVYQRALVQEYLVWEVMDAKINWFALEEGEYVELKPRADGVICSRVFPGLWLDIRGLLAGDEERVLHTLDKGIKSAEHGTFVRKMRNR
jgi:Uma2 family endonuclease